jgi:hypothetical protein
LAEGTGVLARFVGACAEIRETCSVAHRFSFAVRTVAVTLVGFSIAGSGCSAQGEGDRCTYFQGGSAAADPDINGTSECQGGLLCYSGMGGGFNPAYGTYDRCCPVILSTDDTVAACQKVGQGTGDATAGSGVSFDATTEASGTDGGSSSDADSSDAPSDAEHASDAEDATDGPSDGSSSADSG